MKFEIKKVNSFTGESIYFEDGSEMFMPFGLDEALSKQEVQILYEQAVQAVQGGGVVREKHKDTQKNVQ